ncbi:MAG: esterase-like activity of phytase family protein [Lacipirellulaceae bacterium]
MTFLRIASCFTLLSLAVSPCLISESRAARWSITPTGTFTLDTNGLSVAEMSGVMHAGQGFSAIDFLAVQDDGSGGIRFRLNQDPNFGTILSATAIDAFPFTPGMDDEGIARAVELGGFSLPGQRIAYVSNEDDPSIRQIRFTDGAVISTIAAPSVYANRRVNRGFESLASWSNSPDGARLATANEEALTIDGPAATTTNGTVVRVQTYSVLGNPEFAVTAQATKQFAYEVDPIHAGTSTANGARSGLAELIAMPDKTLVAMERSLANSFSPPPFQNRLYEIDSDNATDTGAATYDSGLAGATYTPAGKELLWSGTVGGGFGQNLEGLTVGPKLDNGNWLLVGVVDSGDQLSTNTIITFEATAITTADFNGSGTVEGGDFLHWQRERDSDAISFTADARDADGNRDGDVDADDLSLWTGGYGSAAVVAETVPEPSGIMLLAMSLVILSRRKRSSNTH